MLLCIPGSPCPYLPSATCRMPTRLDGLADFDGNVHPEAVDYATFSPACSSRRHASGRASSMPTLHGRLAPWEPEDLQLLHEAALAILEKTGVRVDDVAVLEALEADGARVDHAGRIVRFDPVMVEERMRHAPGSWDRGAASPGEFSVSADCGAANVWDCLTRAPRPATVRDLVDVPRLVQALPHIDAAGALVFVPELPTEVCDLFLYRHMWQHTDKQGGGGLGRCPSSLFGMSVRAFDAVCDLLEVKIGAQKMRQDPELSFFMGAASPLRWGRDVLEVAARALARGQVVGIGGNCICGVQSPVTPAANVALDHAERLSGLCIVTAIREDARFYFCNHTYFLDMRSGDIASGSPEQTLQALLGEKLLEHCGFRLAVNHPILDTGAHAPDAQAATEKTMYMLLTALGGARGIGGAGQLKELFSYEQLVVDNEIAGYVKHLLKGAAINEETIALDTIHELGIGANFLASEPTVRFARDCYHPPDLFCRSRFSEWLRDGAKDSLTRAQEKVEAVLSSATPTFLTDAQLAAMDDVICKACRDLTPGFDPGPYLVPR